MQTEIKDKPVITTKQMILTKQYRFVDHIWSLNLLLFYCPFAKLRFVRKFLYFLEVIVKIAKLYCQLRPVPNLPGINDVYCKLVALLLWLR